MNRLSRALSILLQLGALPILVSCATLLVDPDARAPVINDFGASNLVITTSNPEAQRLFNQGVLQAYAFNEFEAVRAFKAALAADPACAMCAWGVAWQLGPNINATQRGDQTPMRRYAALARKNMERGTPRERALIEAINARYDDSAAKLPDAAALPGEICGGNDAKLADPLDIAYADRMRALANAYPDDADIASLYAEAVMIATPGDWWNPKTGTAAGEIGTISAQLERLLQKFPAHTGLNHYLIHAVDSSPAPQRALAAADRLGALAPAAPHLLHMPAHIYTRTARYGDAVQANQKALESEVRLAGQLKSQNFKVVKNWDGHNLHYLWFAALMDGRGELSLETARRIATSALGEKRVYAEYRRGLTMLTLLRLQRWNEVLAEPAPAADGSFEPALHAYARAVALARTGQPGKAREAEAIAQKAMTALQGLAKPSRGEKFARGLLEVVQAWQQAELAMAAGDAEAALAAAKRGVEREAALEDSEPPMLAAGSQLLLGQVMLEAKRANVAEQAFRDDLTAHPGNGWALRGLTQSLSQQGKTAEAAETRGQWERAWTTADAALRKL